MAESGEKSKIKYIFITGGVVSSLGKGIVAASLGALLQLRGHKVRIRKLDPYLNLDPGTMSPFEHGEVFVTDDGSETDLDLGHYERFTDVSLTKNDCITSGQIYGDVIQQEREGGFLGKTIQVIPHVTNRIKEFITNNLEDEDFLICEIGGTVGDIEGLPFLEAISQITSEIGKERVLAIHVTLVPFLKTTQEIKTKPTQHSVRELRNSGIQCDIIVCRSEVELSEEVKRKIANTCRVLPDAVIYAPDISSTIYATPKIYYDQGLEKAVVRYFNEEQQELDLSTWEQITNTVLNPQGQVTIAIVGKYTGYADSYKSLQESLDHGGIFNNVRVKTVWIDAELKDQAMLEKLKVADGILVPGGFGLRGIEGKINASKYARINKVPYLGICLGMQASIIDVCRDVMGLLDAHSKEFVRESNNFVILKLSEWLKAGKKIDTSNNSNLGGTMRLGIYPCELKPDSIAANIYNNQSRIYERHRHRYEINGNYIDMIEAGSPLVFSGLSPNKELAEIVEISDKTIHPWFFGVQFHPELKSRPFKPHPVFSSFIRACLESSRLV